MSLRPLGDRIVLEPMKQAEKSSGGLYLPETARDKSSEGTVVAIGTGRVLENGDVIPVGVAVGERLIYSKYSGSEVNLEGSDYVIIAEKDVLAVVSVA